MRIAVQVKICGLTRREDVLLADELGADYVGFVLVKNSRRYVDRANLKNLTQGISCSRVGVFQNAPLEEVKQLSGYFDIIQLHGEEPPEYAAALPLPVWKVLHPGESGDGYPAERFVVDSANGGSGCCCDWQFAAEAARRWRVMLAGGINAANVRAACEAVHPCGVDLAGGVEESYAVKSKAKMIAFFKELEQ